MGQLLRKTDTFALDPRLFAVIMTLPETIRLDLLEFAGSTPIKPEYLAEIVTDLAQHNDSQSIDSLKERILNS